MCGILGGWTREKLPKEAINAAMERLRHRGPDDAGLHEAGTVFLGTRRLAIIDLKTGHQPVFNEDGSICVAFNGEIYNYVELMSGLKARGHTFQTNSDTEVLVHLYEERGEQMVNELRGMFAFAIWDARKRNLFMARDRFGKKPFFYTRTRDGGFLFASELKALKPLAAAAGDRWEIRDQSIYDYLSLSIVPQPETVFQGVFALGAASWMRFDGEQLRQERYWDLDYASKTELPYEEALEQVRAHVGEAVRLRLRSDVPLGVFLSSGIDSSVVAYEAAKQIGGSLQTFTVAVDDSTYDESKIASHTAKYLGVKNTVLRLEVSPVQDIQFLARHYDQPFADSSAIPSYAISRMAVRQLKVVLNGDGGDELFAGYRRYLAASRFEGYQWMPKTMFSALGAVLSRFSRERRSRLGFYTRSAVGMSLQPGGRYLVWTTDMLREPDKERFWKGRRMRSTEALVEQWLRPELSMLRQQLDADRNIFLLSMLLVKMDMATMAASLEARSPLLDHVLADFSAKLPARFLLRGGRTKALLRDAYRNRIPDEVLDGRKRGFEIPLASWLRNELHEVLMDTLGDRKARVRDYLEDSFVDGVLAEKLMTDRNWSYVTYSLLILELWLRESSSQ